MKGLDRTFVLFWVIVWAGAILLGDFVGGALQRVTISRYCPGAAEIPLFSVVGSSR